MFAFYLDALGVYSRYDCVILTVYDLNIIKDDEQCKTINFYNSWMLICSYYSCAHEMILKYNEPKVKNLILLFVFLKQLTFTAPGY